MSLLIRRRLSETFAPLKNRRLMANYIDHWQRFDRWQDRVQKIKDEKKTQTMLKKWLPGSPEHGVEPMYVTPERGEQDLPQTKHISQMTREDHGRLGFDAIQRMPMLRYLDLSMEYQARKERYELMIAMQYDQRLIPERQQKLGPDLAAAHFLINRSAAVKFLGEDTWHQMDKKDQYILPAKFVEGLHCLESVKLSINKEGTFLGLYIEAIDASNTELMYEAFDHFVRLKKLRFLSLADCKHINDWCLSRMNLFENSLEYLDLSNCKRVSANGLSSLACLKKLKFLRLDGLNDVHDLAKCALMLEEKIPNLTVVGVDYEKAALEAERREKLLSHPSVREDARGSLFLKDEVGEMYFLGCKTRMERAILDEDDLPLLRSKIRPDPPVLPAPAALELDALSGHKLRHTLAGSPSSGEKERLAEIDRILILDEKWRRKDAKKSRRPPPVDQILLKPINGAENQLSIDNDGEDERSENMPLDEKKLLTGAGPG